MSIIEGLKKARQWVSLVPMVGKSDAALAKRAESMGSIDAAMRAFEKQEEEREMSTFEVGQKVVKPKGYRFDAEVVSVFMTTTGETRVVAENGEGLLHIFNEGQLEKAPDLRSGSLYEDLSALSTTDLVALLRREGDDWRKNVGGMPLFEAAADRLDSMTQETS